MLCLVLNKGGHASFSPLQGRRTAREERAEAMTVDDFFRRLFGAEVADVVANSLMRGIYAGDAKRLGLREVFPRLVDLQNRHGSLLEALLKEQLSRSSPPPLVTSRLHARALEERWFLWGLEGGMQTLIEALVDDLTARGAKLRTNTVCPPAAFTPSLSCQVGELSFDHLLLAVPAPACLHLLSGHAAFPDLKPLLSSLHYADVAIVGLEYEGDVLPVQGFGHLIPSWELPHVLGTTYDSCIFPTEGTRIGTMFGGAWFEAHCAGMTEADFVTAARDAARTQLGIGGAPRRVYYRLNRACIPQPEVGHARRVAEARRALEGCPHSVRLVGSAFDGVSLNDCARSGWQVAESLTREQ